MASGSGSEVSDGPVLGLITKKLRALKKKHSRIIQLEESQAQGKTLNKEQLDLLKSKVAVSGLIDEYEKLRQPLASALQEELSRISPPPPPSPSKVLEEGDEEEPKINDSELEDLIKLLYFGCLFDVKSQSEFTSTLLTRTHERGCCLTYDYVTEDATDLLGENDLDMISALGGLLTSRPVYSGVSHKNALEGCIQRAKLWLQKSDEPIIPGASVTYSGLREKVNKIMSLDYFTMTPEMKLPVDVASVVGKYNITMQAADVGVLLVQDEHQTDDGSHYHHKENEQEEFQGSEGSSIDHSSPPEETVTDDASTLIPSGDVTTIQQDEERVEVDVEHNQRDSEHNEQQQYIIRRGYQNHRNGGGGGRRGYYSNGRGGRGGRGGGGYQNGRGQQYHEVGYYPRNYHNTRGRGGGRSGGSGMYSNNHGAVAPSHGGKVEVQANS